MSTDDQQRSVSSRRRVLSGQVVRFAIVGAASTVLALGLFALFDQFMGRQLANFVALVLSTVINTTANRYFTFGVRGSQGHAKVQLQSLALLAVTWAVTAVALVILHHVAPGASTFWATVTVGLGNFIATAVRFVLLRRWMDPTATTAQDAAEAIPTEF